MASAWAKCAALEHATRLASLTKWTRPATAVGLLAGLSTATLLAILQ